MSEYPARRKEDPRIVNLTTRMVSVEDEVKRNTEICLRVETNTQAIVEAWAALAGVLKVLTVLGRVSKYVAYVAMAISTVSAAWFAVTHWGAVPQLPPDIK